MNRFYQILCLALLAAVSARAQQSTPSVFTLEQSIQYAIENSNTIKNAVIDERISDAKVKETRGLGLPQIDASVSLQHNQKLQRFFTTYDPDGGFIQLPPTPGLNKGDVISAQNFFQLKSSGNAALNINQLLFSSSYLVGLKAANTYRELSSKTTTQTKEQITENVTKAYYAVLINKDRMELFDNNINRVDSLLKTTRAMFENGFAESIDADRIQVNLNNLKAERDKFYNMQQLGLELLKFQMNYPMNEQIEISGDISSLQIDETLLSQYALDWDYSQRTDYSLLQTSRKLQTLDIKNQYANSLPTLSAFATLGYSTQSPTISGLFRTETGIPDAGGLGPDKWYSYSLFGITMNVPIFSGLQRTYKIQQSKLSLQKIENDFLTLKSSIDVEVKTAATNYLNAVTSLKSQQENKVLAENVARITKIKYEQGVGSNTEVVDAESALKEAQVNYYSALYDALVAKVDLDKAYGKLNKQQPSISK